MKVASSVTGPVAEAAAGAVTMAPMSASDARTAAARPGLSVRFFIVHTPPSTAALAPTDSGRVLPSIASVSASFHSARFSMKATWPLFSK